MTPHQDPPHVDELRSRLRALGYLDAGVSRFVLAPVRADRDIGAIALRSSLRIGVLAGALLGPAAAVGIALRLPGLVTGAWDAVVVAAYLGLLFGAGVACASWLASWTAGALIRRSAGGSSRYAAAPARRTRLLAAAAGGLVSAACLAYLTLWWRTADAAAGWGSPAWSAFALAVAVSISLLLGSSVALTVLAVAARALGSDQLARRPLAPSRRRSMALGALAFAAAFVLLLSTAADEGTPAAAAEYAILSTGTRVTVVAVDGFDVRLYDRLAAAGGVPNLSVVLDSARARAAAAEPADPARVWTSIATGHDVGAHGIAGLELRRLPGVQGLVAPDRSPTATRIAAATDLLRLTRPALASAAQRREKTIWEVAAENGLRTAVVNWWATWPAPVNAGVIVTDRAALRLERGGALDAEIAPAALYPSLQKAWPRLVRDARAAAAAFDEEEPATREVMRRAAELDALHVALARELPIDRPDLLLVYLPGLDIVQHTVLGGLAGAPASAVAGRLDAVARYYTFLDALLEPLLAPDEAGALSVLLTHPGRVREPTEALLGARGGPAAAGARVEADLRDIAPTLLYALGFPVSAELPGRALTELFGADFVERYPVRRVAGYGGRTPDAAPRGGQPLDREMIERLRSLGYVR